MVNIILVLLCFFFWLWTAIPQYFSQFKHKVQSTYKTGFIARFYYWLFYHLNILNGQQKRT